MKNLTSRASRAFISLLLLLALHHSDVAAGNPAATSNSIASTHNFGGGPLDQQLLVNLMVIQPGNIEVLADGFRIRYNTGYLTSTVDDILKMTNFAENLSSYRENKELIVERRPLIVTRDTIYIHLTNTQIRNYRLKLHTQSFIGDNTVAWVEDAWLNTHTLFSLKGDTTDLDFSVTADPASSAINRFRVVFFRVSPLPVDFTGISAFRKDDKVQVNWSVENEMDIMKYAIERSADGIQFSSAGTVYPLNTNGNAGAYKWDDVTPYKGNSYYRIRSTGIGGEIKYSDIARVTIPAAGTVLNVFPNPVTNGKFTIQLQNAPAGWYQAQLTDISGRTIMSWQFNITASNTSKELSINKPVSSGVCRLQVTGPDGAKQSLAVHLIGQ